MRHAVAQLLPTLLFTRQPACRQLVMREAPTASATQGVANLVISEGGDWLVVNKPSGTSVHDGPLSLLALLKGAGLGSRCVPAHRLDIETSGVMLVAKSPEAVPALQKALASPQTLKSYRAVLRGRVREPQGLWSQKLTTKSEGRRNPQGSAQDRVDAQTWFEVLGGNGRATVAQLRLHTGRTHQIRKHAALAGNPVLGDTRYGDPAHAAGVARKFGFGGMALHSESLSLELDGKLQTFTADIPSSWLPLLQPLGDLSAPSPASQTPALNSTSQPSRSVETGETGRGTVVSWNLRRGYGFVARAEGTFTPGADPGEIYVHQRSILKTARGDGYRSLRVGEPVEFTLATMPTDGRMEALRVTGPDGAPVQGQPPMPAKPVGRRAAPRAGSAPRKAGDGQDR